MLHRLPGFAQLSDAQLDEKLADEVAEKKSRLIAFLKQEDIRVTGWRKVTREHYARTPSSPDELFDRGPTFAASTQERRDRLERELDEFRAAYYAALRRYRDGEDNVEFPYGTWLLVHR